MNHRDPRVDAYIANSADFAKPILIHFRELLHSVCPDVEEAIKWGCPHFVYKGQLMCNMASFKHHAVAGFSKAALMTGGEKLVEMAKSEEAMGHLGKLTSVKDLPKDATLKKYIREAMKLNEAGVKLSRKTAVEKAALVVPDYFLKALSKNKKALNAFEDFSPSHKREYVSWITEAKTDATREKRMAQAIEMMSEGKSRHWRYK